MPEHDELYYAYPIPLDVSMCSPAGALYPSAYQRFITDMVQEHLVNIGMGIPSLVSQYGISWVLLAMSIQIQRPFRITDSLHVRTWNTSRHLPVYRREFAVYDEEEHPVAVGTTFSSLLDLKARHICMRPEIHNMFHLPDGKEALEAVSRFQEEPCFIEVETRKVRPSWLDGLGHVNNSRYGDFVFDALSPEEQAAMGRLSRLDVWFQAELKQGMSFVMEKAAKENSIYVRGVILPDKKVSFVMKLTF